jgi:hypothetical protein
MTVEILPPEQPRARRTMSRTVDVARSGIGFGSALAIAISWSLHKSVLWSIFHGFLSWLYVIYHVLTR